MTHAFGVRWWDFRSKKTKIATAASVYWALIMCRPLTQGFIPIPDTRPTATPKLAFLLAPLSIGQLSLWINSILWPLILQVSGADCEEGPLRPFPPYPKVNWETSLGRGTITTVEKKADPQLPYWKEGGCRDALTMRELLSSCSGWHHRVHCPLTGLD